MGCGLRKLRQAEDSSPGKIYSTLKRPQVETKVGVAYTYRHLDFLVGKEDGTSTLCLSSVRELPSQLLELYQQGFTLAAVHPFVHPCGPEPASIQRQLYRAVLIRLSDSLEKTQPDNEPHHLKLEECLSADQFPTTELIQGYVKKIQDAADQGIMFVGFIQEPCRLRPRGQGQGEPEEPSLSLHSSPSSLHCSGLEQSPSPLEATTPEKQDQGEVNGPGSGGSVCEDRGLSLPEDETGNARSSGDGGGDILSDETSLPKLPLLKMDTDQEQDVTEEDNLTHNNNEAKVTDLTEKQRSPPRTKNGVELFGLFNRPGSSEGQLKYFTVKVPLRVQLRDEGGRGVEANWLDHMTQHFNSGASLVDGYFHLGDDNDLLPKSVESVFIFQEGLEGDSATTTAYDAIVVEQWTVIDGVQIKTDYVPLLQSLAMYGWRLTCVLPTPIIKTNSDGSLATKQIVFLQRPVLPRKRRDSKKLIFKTRNKSSKNSVKDAPKNKKKKNAPPTVEKELDDQKISDGMEKTSKDESKSVNERKEKREERETESEVETAYKVEEMEEGNEGGAATEEEREGEAWIEERKEGGSETKGGNEGGVETGEEKKGEVETEERKEAEPERMIEGDAETEAGNEGGVESKEEGETEEKTLKMEVKEGDTERSDMDTEKKVAVQQDSSLQPEQAGREAEQHDNAVDGQVQSANESSGKGPNGVNVEVEESATSACPANQEPVQEEQAVVNV